MQILCNWNIFVANENNKTLNQKISTRVTCNQILVYADTLLDTTIKSIIDQNDDPVKPASHSPTDRNENRKKNRAVGELSSEENNNRR